MVDFIAVLIYNPRHQYGRVVLAVIGHGAITICQVQEIDIARSQGQRRFVGKRTGDTHVLGRTDDIGYSHLLTELDGNGVDTLGKGALERDAIAREASIGVGRPPGIVLASLLVKHLHLNILVSALVTGSNSLIHCLGIDKEFEGGSWLTLCRHLVILPRLKINITMCGLLR